MRLQIPLYIQDTIKAFIRSGHELHLVGGSVRDMLLGLPAKDWDFATSATPEEILKLFPDAFYDNNFGTVGIPIKNLPYSSLSAEERDLRVIPEEGETNKPQTQIVEVTTYRTEQTYTDRRHPESVSWGKTIDEDLMRRDFTVNAIAIEATSLESESPTIIDPYGGQEDLEKKIIRAVGNPAERFKEDALRLLRAVRFATQLGFGIDVKTLEAIISDSGLLAEISGERIRDELLKILASPYPYEGVMLLKNTGLLAYCLPELLEGIGVSQERPGRHHKDDVFTHNVLSLKYTPAADPIVRFAALIHDVGKPRVAAEDADGYVIFHNHELIGARMAYEIADRLRLSKKQRQKIVTLVRWHMFTVDEHITDSAVRRFIRRVGIDNVKDMMDLRIGDRLGGGTQTAESWRLKLFKKRVEEQLAPAPFSINDLAIDGNDIMQELNLPPSKKIGDILQTLFDEVDEDLSKNTKEYLLKRLHEMELAK